MKGKQITSFIDRVYYEVKLFYLLKKLIKGSRYELRRGEILK